MSQDNPFSAYDDDQDRTIIKPMPGGGPPLEQAATATPMVAPPSQGSVAPIRLPSGGGLSPLENAASPLLSLLMQVKNTLSHPQPAALRNQLIQEIQRFEQSVRAQGIDEITTMRARYVLCTVMDEVVLNTPWGNASKWSEKSLLSTFHNETWGGEKFFLLLDRLIQDPAGNLALLELMYLCLAFGFEGRYRLLDNGHARLEQQRERLYRAIRNQRGEFERELSPHWQGVTDQRNALVRYVPLWVIAAILGLLLLLGYLFFSWLLGDRSDPVFRALDAFRDDTVAMVQRNVDIIPPSPPPPPPNVKTLKEYFRSFLEPEIRANKVRVIELKGKTAIRLLGDGLFASGSANIKSDFLPLLLRIAQELKYVEGRVLITGHTDSVPIRGRMILKFKDNWHLSKARAEAVQNILVSTSQTPERFSIEPRGHYAPAVDPEITARDRALNRRVELVLLTSVQHVKIKVPKP